MRHTLRQAAAKAAGTTATRQDRIDKIAPGMGRKAVARSQDGKRATAHKFTKMWRTVEGVPATHFDGDKRVNGALVKVAPTASASPKRTGRGTVRAETAGREAAKLADACKLYSALRARCVKGGSWWRACRSRKARKRLRAIVHQADQHASQGDWLGAVQILRDN